MPNKFSTGTCSIAILALSLVVSTMPAYAGFEWVAPSDAAANQPMPAPNSYAVGQRPAMSNPEVISPVIITGDTVPSSQAPVQAQSAYRPTTSNQYNAGNVAISSSSYAPPPSTYAPAANNPQAIPSAYGAVYTPDVGMQSPTGLIESQSPPSSMANATLNLSNNSGDVVQGFASDVPLALALRQILPVGYNFSIDQNIDMDTLVSYKGGRSWRETTKDMLASVNLIAREQDSTLTISKPGSIAVVTPSSTTVIANAPQVTMVSSPSVVMDNTNGSLATPISISRSPGMAPAPMHGMDEPSINVGSGEGWTADRGDTLRKVLTEWCKRSGVELQWLAEYDYPMEASAHFSGGFEDAVRLLLAGFESARPQPVAELHTNATAGQMLLVVQTRGNNFAN